MIRKIIANNFALPISDRLNNQNVREIYKLFIDSINWSRDEINIFSSEKNKRAFELFIF